MDTLGRLQAWYLSQCNGQWEHRYGVQIDTLDNPGWRVRVELSGTALAAVPFSPVEVSQSDSNWYVCKVQEEVFEGFGGALNLGEILDVFLDWAETVGGMKAE